MLSETIKVIRRQTDIEPTTAIILGSGLGGVADAIDADAVLPYSELPGFSTSHAAGHRGQLIIGHLAGQPVVAMAGRFHFYEGYSIEQIQYPVAVMAALSARTLIVSNAAGGVRPGLRVGDLVILDSMMSWWTGFGLPRPKLRDGNDYGNQASPNRPPIGSGYRGELFDKNLARTAAAFGRQNGFTLKSGCYLAMTGPTYETRSEYRMMRRMGVDVVGMSTVGEVHMARNCGMDVLGLSMVSNVATPDQVQSVGHDEVIAAGLDGSVKMEAIVRCLMAPRADARENPAVIVR